jgi:urease beta subunit
LKLNEAERDRLLVYLTAELARARRGRGLLLNVVEATALVADAVGEAARDGKHFHFFEANPRLRFDRAAAYGMHLAAAAGAAVRFEPGARERALEKARACGYLDTTSTS